MFNYFRNLHYNLPVVPLLAVYTFLRQQRVAKLFDIEVVVLWGLKLIAEHFSALGLGLVGLDPPVERFGFVERNKDQPLDELPSGSRKRWQIIN